MHDPPWRDDAARANWISIQHPAGGLWSTAADLVRFGQMLLRRGAPVLSPAAFAAMTSLQTTGIPNRTGSGEFDKASPQPGARAMNAVTTELACGEHWQGKARGNLPEILTATGTK